ncbi:MAG: SDR family NAD(P)-dependent oxidoreductase [Chloroflexi bacterium]|nr:SDR family NAD(P)-dependent oxidoreductase [Chloroflexota bacterium]
MKLQDRVAIVTGGASGLGAATVRELIAGHAYAAIFDIQTDRGAQLAGELGERAMALVVDVTDEDSVTGGVRRVVERFGAIHICVNCAGVPFAAKTVGRNGEPFPLALFRRVIDVNLIGTFNVMRLAAAEMVKNQPDADGERGVIVNTSSGAAFDGQVGQAAYSASKAAIIGLNLPVARDLSEAGIRVNAIAPGLFDTPLVATLPEKARAALIDTTLFPRRIGQPEEFARLVRHIVENSYMNAETIRFDAGARMNQR